METPAQSVCNVDTSPTNTTRPSQSNGWQLSEYLFLQCSRVPTDALSATQTPIVGSDGPPIPLLNLAPPPPTSPLSKDQLRKVHNELRKVVEELDEWASYTTHSVRPLTQEEYDLQKKRSEELMERVLELNRKIEGWRIRIASERPCRTSFLGRLVKVLQLVNVYISRCAAVPNCTAINAVDFALSQFASGTVYTNGIRCGKLNVITLHLHS